MEFGLILMMALTGALGYRIRGGFLQDIGQEPKWYNGTFTNRLLFILMMAVPFGVSISFVGAAVLIPLLYLSLSMRLYPWQYMFNGFDDVKDLAVRGVVGVLPLLPVVFYYASMPLVLLWLFSGLLMGPTYYLGQYLARVIPPQNRSLGVSDHGNNLSEYLYGVVFGISMGITILFGN